MLSLPMGRRCWKAFTVFYYDVDLEHRISTDDFEQIEAEMKKVVKGKPDF